MVRRDPMNERGPAPPGGRVPQPRVTPNVPTSLFTLRPSEEYEKLWAAGIVNLDTALRTIQAYIDIGLPGANASEIEELVDRFAQLREDAPK